MVDYAAIRKDSTALLDWNGNLRSGTGPTRVFARFPRSSTSVTAAKSGPTRHITFREGEGEVRVQCTLGLFAPGKKEMREVLATLGADSQP